MTTPTPKPRGFAAMALKNPDRLRQIAAKGGATREPHLRSFAQNSDLAKEAGRKGGLVRKNPLTSAE
jgi:general stress protein YciG